MRSGMLGNEVQELLKSEGHTVKVIRIARKRFGVVLRCEGFGKGSKVFWRLPPNAITVGPGIIPAWGA